MSSERKQIPYFRFDVEKLRCTAHLIKKQPPTHLQGMLFKVDGNEQPFTTVRVLSNPTYFCAPLLIIMNECAIHELLSVIRCTFHKKTRPKMRQFFHVVLSSLPSN